MRFGVSRSSRGRRIGGSIQKRNRATARRVRASRTKGVRIVPPRPRTFCMIRRGKQEARVVVGQFGPIGFGGVSRLPRSLHSVNPSRLRVNRRT